MWLQISRWLVRLRRFALFADNVSPSICQPSWYCCLSLCCDNGVCESVRHAHTERERELNFHILLTYMCFLHDNTAAESLVSALPMDDVYLFGVVHPLVGGMRCGVSWWQQSVHYDALELCIGNVGVATWKARGLFIGVL